MKPWYQSKTVWINVGVLIFSFLVDLPAELRELGVSDDAALRIGTIGNIGLRLISTAKLVLSSES